MVRFLYSFLFYLILPGVFFRMLWRSRRLPDYRARLSERLGFYSSAFEKCLWVHAVSVGEIIAATPMIKALQVKYPSLPILVTTMTPTGAARVKSTFGDTVKHVYIPYDLPGAVSRFLNAMNPVASIIVETELWPNLFAACHKRNIPMCLVNARLSEKSAHGYRRVASLTREMLSHMALIAANGQPDADRFIALGALKERVVVTGNVKFDLTLPENLTRDSRALREMLGKNRFVWIAASTHEGEEEIILAAHKKLRQHNPDVLLVLVPRHPDRFESVAKLCEKEFVTERRSRRQLCRAETEVFLGDSMGELLLMYSIADVAFVAGSLVPKGGHNILEPAVLSKPILTGPHVFNFLEICELFFAAKALKKVVDAETLSEQLLLLMHDVNARLKMGEYAIHVMNENRGALMKQLTLVHEVLGTR